MPRSMLATRGRFETAAQAALPLLREKRTWLILIGLAALVVRLPLFFVSAAA